MDTSYSRFHLKVAADGFLLIDGVMALGPMLHIVTNALEACKFPPLDLSVLNRYAGNQTFTYDMQANENHVHIEIVILSDPGVAPEALPRRHAV